MATSTDTAPTTNREIREETALALAFSKEKALPLIPTDFATKTGSVTYASIRKALKTSRPELSGDALTTEVERIKNEMDSVVLAQIIRANREGFHVNRFVGRELKSGVRNITVAMSNGRDKASKPAKTLANMSVEELEAEILRRRAAEAPVVDVESTTSEA